ncbi:MAG: ATPase, T2SS/T4P/T4SS family [Candidatus Methanodesulfokora sp.]
MRIDRIRTAAEGIIGSSSMLEVKLGEYTVNEPTLPEEILEELKGEIFGKILEKGKDKAIESAVKKYEGKIPKDLLIYIIRRDIFGLGEIQPLLLDPSIEDIVYPLTGDDTVYVNINGNWMRTNIRINNDKSKEIAFRLAELMGRQLSYGHPRAEGMIELDGIKARAHVFLTEDGAVISIRKYTKEISLLDLVKSGTITADLAAYLEMAVVHGLSGLIIGETGTGKTTLLKALLERIPENKRVVVVEDSEEIWLRGRRNFTRLVGRDQHTLVDIMKDVLRMRPDYVVLGEARGEETKLLAQYIRLGGSGLTTFHASSIRSALRRLISYPIELNRDVIEDFSLFILIKRMPDGKRQVVEVAEPNENSIASTYLGGWVSRGQIVEKIAEREARDEKNVEEELSERKKRILEEISNEKG